MRKVGWLGLLVWLWALPVWADHQEFLFDPSPGVHDGQVLPPQNPRIALTEEEDLRHRTTHKSFEFGASPSPNVVSYEIWSCITKPCNATSAVFEATISSASSLRLTIPHLINIFFIARAKDSNGLYSSFTTGVGIETAGPQPPQNPQIVDSTGDVTDPVTILTAPASGATVTGAAVTVSATCTDNSGACVGVLFFRRSPSGTVETNLAAEDTTDPYSISVDSTVLANGEYDFCARGRDPVGLVSVSCVPVTVNNAGADVTDPVTTVTAPPNGVNVSSTVQLTGTCTDNIGCVSAQWKIDGVNFGTPYSGGGVNNIVIPWNTTGYTNENHTISLEGADAAGNVDQTPGSVTVTVANNTGGGGSTVPPAGIAQYPTTFMDTTPIAEPVTQVIVTQASNFQTVLDTTPCNRTIVVDSGAVFQQKVIVRNKGCTASTPIVIRPSNLTGFPVYGEALANRVNPVTHAANMYKLRSPAGSQQNIMLFEQGAAHYRIIGAEFWMHSVDWTVTADQDAVDVGQHPNCCIYPDTDAKMPHDIVFDRVIVHGNTRGSHKRGISLNGTRLAIVNSYFYDIHQVGGDGGVCVGGWAGRGIFKIVNNHFECAGIQILIGGASPWIDQLVTEDIEIRRNFFYKPTRWFDDSPNYAGDPWSSKNIIECKNCRRVLIHGNYMEGNYVMSNQQGFAVISSTNNDEGNCTWCVVEHFTVQYNYITNTAAAFNIKAQDFQSVSPFALESGTGNHNLFRQNIVRATYAANGGLASQKFGTQCNICGIDARFDHNTFFTANNDTAVLWLENPANTNLHYTNNITFKSGPLGGFNGSGCGTGAACFTSYTSGTSLAAGNLIIAGSPSEDPANNSYPATEAAAGFVDPANGNYKLSGTSPYLTASTTGGIPGADWDQVLVETANLREAEPDGVYATVSTDIHVAKTGNDTTGNGSVGNPYLTIAKGLSTMIGGDTLTIHVGSYGERIVGTLVPAGASWSEPTIIRAALGETVTLNPTTSFEVATLNTNTMMFLELRDLILDGINQADGCTNRDGLKLEGTTNEVRLVRVTIKRTKCNNILVAAGAHHLYVESSVLQDAHDVTLAGEPHGVYVEGHHVTVQDTEISGADGYGVHNFSVNFDGTSAHDNTYIRNRIHDNGNGVTGGQAGILLSSGINNLAANNFIYNEERGISLVHGSNKVLNNTIYNIGDRGIFLEWGNGAETIENNIVVNAGTDIEVKRGSNSVVRNNIINDAAIVNTGIGTTISGNLVSQSTANLLFVDAVNGNLDIQSGSIAQDAGLTKTEFTDDIDGTTRPVGAAWDIGAFEIP